MYCCLQILRIIWVTWLIGLLVTVTYSSAGAFVLPDTGITTCHNAAGDVIVCPFDEADPYYGQDAQFGPGSMSFALGAGDFAGTVTDLNTGLVWEQKVNGDSIDNPAGFGDADNLYSWADAHLLVAAMNAAIYLGYDDWRLPSKQELGYLLDLSIVEPGPSIDPTFFPQTRQGKYWTSEEDVDDLANSRAWAYDFRTCLDEVFPKTDQYHVRVVRGLVQ